MGFKKRVSMQDLQENTVLEEKVRYLNDVNLENAKLQKSNAELQRINKKQIARLNSHELVKQHRDALQARVAELVTKYEPLSFAKPEEKTETPEKT